MNEHVVNEALRTDAGVSDLTHAGAPTPIARMHRPKQLRQMLRGRYLWVFLLGTIGALGGGVGGYKYVKPLYRSTALIEVKPYVPRIMFKTEETQLMPMFDQFVGSQVELIRSPRVVNKAMADKKWLQFGRGVSPEAKQGFRDSLAVTRQRRSNLVGISFTDEDPKAAKVAVNLLMEAYMVIYGERDSISRADRLATLNRRQKRLSDQIDSKRKEIQDLADEYGSDSLEDMYGFELQELQQLKHALRTTELEAVAVGVALDTSAEDDSADDPDAKDRQAKEKMSVQRIAQLDNRMYALLEEKRRIDNDLAMKRVRLVDKHPEIQALLKLQSATQQTIESYAEQFRTNGPTARGSAKAGLVDAEAEKLRLERQRRQLGALHEKAREETLKLGRKHLAISGLKEQRASLREWLAQTKNRIQQFEVESAIGRIDKISEGEGSPMPVNAGKRKQMAVLGFVGGGCVGVGLVLLAGYRNRRLRDSEDAELGIGEVRMLGLLPYLPEDLRDSDNAANACYGVHHIRVLLQLDPHGVGTEVFAVTSPGPQTGKTSLTLALGLSFASSGCKTLLIDADIGGGGLTHRLQAVIRRRLGQILRRDGLIDEKQLQQALQLARSESKPLGRTLVEMGVLSEDDLAQALGNQRLMPIGLLDALDGEPLEACITKTGIANLEILPVGKAMADDISRISPLGIRQVIDGARKRYDTILLDTGPVPAAAISGIAASAADQTVVVVSRGDQRVPVERAIAFLNSIGATLAGVVFNRAAARDIARSRHSAAEWSRLSGQSGDKTDRVSARRISRQTALACVDNFDPVTRAVAGASAPQTSDEETGN